MVEYGPFEMHDEDYEMQVRSQQTPQELEGTTVPLAELAGEEKRRSVRSMRESGVLGTIVHDGEEDEQDDDEEDEEAESRPASVHEAVPGIVVGGRRDAT